ncbi:MAG: zinc-binding dehydrogenase [Kiritimatiellae bacterium]|nr:zinc-binding dehydrogenase [Kiritimatiellia bacterium]
MRNRSVTFVAPDQVELIEGELDGGSLKQGEVLLETECSVVSAGTELAILSGNESWAKLPRVPGYGAVGKVVGLGGAENGVRLGDRLFHYGPHQAFAKATGVVLPVPNGLDPRLAAVARLGQVAFTAVRVSNVELGDTVAVQGLGLVGNLAAQLMGLAGCTVIGLDISAKRRETARACGIPHTVDPKARDPVEAVRALTQGSLCECVVEATGVPDLVPTAAGLAGKAGEVILLGSPRGEFTGDTTALLNAVHLWGNCVTLKGAHEWRFPRRDDGKGHIKHSLERNLRQLMDFMLNDRLKIEPLITHVAQPHQCAEVYANLRQRNEEYLGVVFDWRTANQSS